MSYETTDRALTILNTELSARRQQGSPIKVNIKGIPELHIESFDPLIYREYGRFVNRAPHITGSLALRAFLWMPHTVEGALVYVGLEANRSGYGFGMYPQNPRHLQLIDGIAERLGHPDITSSSAF